MIQAKKADKEQITKSLRVGQSRDSVCALCRMFVRIHVSACEARQRSKRMIQLRAQEDRMKTSQEPAGLIFTAIRGRSATLHRWTCASWQRRSEPSWSLRHFKFMFYCQIEKTVTVKCLLRLSDCNFNSLTSARREYF